MRHRGRGSTGGVLRSNSDYSVAKCPWDSMPRLLSLGLATRFGAASELGILIPGCWSGAIPAPTDCTDYTT